MQLDTLDELLPPLVPHQVTRDGEGNVKSVVEKRAGRDPETAVKIPNAQVGRTSTLYDREGNVSAQWVIERPEDRARFEQLTLWAQKLAETLPAKPLIAAPLPPTIAELCVGYPIGDHHLGMLAWKHETGESYDIDLSQEILTKAVQQLVGSAPPAKQGVVAFLGDFFHYDSFDPVTPTHRNLLDADGRAPKMISAGMQLMEDVIDLAAQRHSTVQVIVELGNHDAYTSMIAARWLDRVYRDNPRVVVDIAPGHFHYFEWGKCLVGTHHGDGRAAKAAQLPGIMAADRSEAWGRTKYRMWWTGHVHHQSVHEFPGCSTESFRILAPADAYAFNNGYRSASDMKAIVLHREYGEVGRNVVNPAMLREGAIT